MFGSLIRLGPTTRDNLGVGSALVQYGREPPPPPTPCNFTLGTRENKQIVLKWSSTSSSFRSIRFTTAPEVFAGHKTMSFYNGAKFTRRMLCAVRQDSIMTWKSIWQSFLCILRLYGNYVENGQFSWPFSRNHVKDNPDTFI